MDFLVFFNVIPSSLFFIPVVFLLLNWTPCSYIVDSVIVHRWYNNSNEASFIELHITSERIWKEGEFLAFEVWAWTKMTSWKQCGHQQI